MLGTAEYCRRERRGEGKMGKEGLAGEERKERKVLREMEYIIIISCF